MDNTFEAHMKQLARLSVFFKEATEEDMISLFIYLQINLEKVPTLMGRYTCSEILKEISNREGKTYEQILDYLKNY